jgi:hypothetical protein
VDEPVAMAEIVIRQAAFFRTEQQSHAASRAQPLADELRTFGQYFEWLAQFPITGSGGAHNQGAIRHGFCHAAILLRLRQQWRRAHSGTGFAERRFIRIHHSQAGKAQVAHGPRRRANVERIAGRNQHDADAVEFRISRQE